MLTEYQKRIELLKKKSHLTTTDVGSIIFLSGSSVTIYCDEGLIAFSRVHNGRRKILHEDVKAFMALHGIRNPDYVSDKELEAVKATLGNKALEPSPDELLIRIGMVMGAAEHPKEKIRRMREVLDANRS